MMYRVGFSRIDLLFPIILILLCFLEIFFFKHKISGYAHDIYFYQQIVFLNGTHILFSFFTVFFIPQGRIWLKDHLNTDPFFFVKMALVAISIFTITAVTQFQLLSNSSILASTILLRFFTIHHGFTQSQGIWLLNIKESELRDKIKFMSRIIITTFFIFWSAQLLLKLNPVIIPIVGLAIWGGYLFFLIPYRHRNITDDLMYSCRFFLPFLFPVSTISAYGQASVHGVEYLSIFKFQSLRMGLTPIKLLFVLILIWLLFYITFYPDQIARHFGYKISHNTLGWVNSFQMSVLFTHYFLDRYIYGWRFPSSSKWIMPALK